MNSATVPFSSFRYPSLVILEKSVGSAGNGDLGGQTSSRGRGLETSDLTMRITWNLKSHFEIKMNTLVHNKHIEQLINNVLIKI